MRHQPPLDLDLRPLPRDAVVCDIVYAPLETPLLAGRGSRGNPLVDGLGMLLHQARPGFAAWFGQMPEVTPGAARLVLAGDALPRMIHPRPDRVDRHGQEHRGGDVPAAGVPVIDADASGPPPAGDAAARPCR